MERLLVAVGRFVRTEDGQDLVEYGLLAVLIAVTALAAIGTAGTAIRTVLWDYIAAAV